MSESQSAAGRRITSLLDANSFVEIGGQVTARSTDFNLSAKSTPSDGVITGYGTVDGSLVYVYSQDAAVLGGTIGEMHAKKITNIYRLARKMGAPVVGMLDSNGVRLEESTDALNSLGRLYRSLVMTSGLVPSVMAVFGNCGGGLSFLPALADFTFMESTQAKLFVNAPDTIEGSSADRLDNRTADFQSENGNVDFTGTENEIFENIRKLIGFLPFNNEDDGSAVPCTDDLNRSCAGLASTIGDASETLKAIADNNEFYEVKKAYGPGMITGFIRLNGATVGAVANRGDEASLRAKGIEKAADFITFCDAFNIPVLTLANASGFHQCVCTERRTPKEAARLAYAYANATVPKVTVVTGKAYGSAYILMGSKAVGADLVYAWPEAEIGMMDAKSAVKLMYDGSDAESLAKEEEAYRALQQSVASAARRGYVDTIIEDADTRKYVIGAFEMLYTKRENRPDRKHGTV